MTRPAVIIGVGGTGQWVLTYLKKDLLEEGNGELPSNVKFLAFDTMPQSEVKLGSSDKEEETVSVGSVQLDASEYVHVGGNAYPLGEMIFKDQQNQKYPHIRKWFQSNFWWRALPPAAWILDEGAGRIRQLGRLAIFKDVMEGPTGSYVWRSLQTAINAVSGQVTEEKRLEIILVGSFAGGTGSGMFLDIALILRKLTEKQNPPPTIRGYFALPSVFGAKQSDEMWARTFAAWRELNRFMVVNNDFPMRVDYIANNPAYQVEHNKHLFDACYLVGGNKNNKADAKYSVFPALAEGISAMLDDEAGTAYTRYVWQNLAPEYANRAGTPLYSTIGTYTLKVPAYYKQQMASHNFSIDILKAVLQPRNWLATGGDRLLSLSQADRNPEKGVGKPGRDEADLFMKSNEISFQPPTGTKDIARPTLFMAKIQRIVDKRGVNDRQMVEDHATAILKSRQGDIEDPSWLIPFTDLGDDPRFGKLRQEVNDQVNIVLTQIYGPNPSEKAKQAALRVLGSERDIKGFVFDNYGGETGEAETYGKFGEVLQGCADFQLQLFRRMVRLWTLDTLTGRAEDPLIARQGKLGYAYDFFNGLIDNFERVRLFLEAVETKRQEEKPRLTAEAMAETAKKSLDTKKEKIFLWFFEHPDVKKSLHHYLRSLQRLVDLRKEETLHYYVMQTLHEMKEIVIKARDEIGRWIWHLATGDDPTNLPGLYTIIKRSQDVVSGDHKIDQDIAQVAVQELIAAEPTGADQAELARVLSWWHWEGRFTDNQLQLKVRFQPEEQSEQELQPVWRAKGELQRVTAEKNRQAFLNVTAVHFQGVMQRTEVAKELASGRQFPTGGDLASHIGNRAEPFSEKISGENPARRSNIIRVNYTTGDAHVQSYFKSSIGLEGSLRNAEKLDAAKPDDAYLITVENSSNPYKLTVVRTDDLYTHEAFQEWTECQTAYETFLFKGQGHNDPRYLHNFATEINASHYEKRMGIQGAFKPLHPKVVMLLEERDKFELAIDCLLTALIRSGRDKKSWRLSMRSGRQEQEVYLTAPFVSTESAQQEPDVFHALYSFLIMGHDIRPGYTQRQINYQTVRQMVEEVKTKKGWHDNMDQVLEHHLTNPNGMVISWDQQAKDEFGNEVKPEFSDLARLVRLIFEDRIEKLKNQTPETETGLPWDVLDFTSKPTSEEKKLSPSAPSEPEANDSSDYSWG